MKEIQFFLEQYQKTMELGKNRCKCNFEPNCITVNYNGSVGEAFYQKDPFGGVR